IFAQKPRSDYGICNCENQYFLQVISATSVPLLSNRLSAKQTGIESTINLRCILDKTDRLLYI
ncbi:MAG: hypothetical protein LBH28_10195, partial [Oscillospiraceae bacterium]|nr:hypothetical protein [Oscillospiraceae bacterium]